MSFTSIDYAQETIQTIVHHDKTVMPKFVHIELNNSYFKIINKFKKLTDAYAVMNTSLI